MKIVLVDQDTFQFALSVYTDSWRESHRNICTQLFLENRDYEGYLRDKLGQLYLITDTVPVGVFALEDNLLSDLYIRPDYQGRGYGTQAVRFALDKFPQLRLTVLSNNFGAIRLYEKMGFRFTGHDIPLRDGLLEREMRYMEKHNG